jgi:O-glycosyl hydrolase
MAIRLCAAAILLALISPWDALARTWTDKQGRTVEAEFVKVVQDKVMLNRSGRSITVPLSELSDADLKFIATKTGADPIAAGGTVQVIIQPTRLRQEFQGLGCGVQFYAGHITSLAARQKDNLQRKLYDDMFAKVPTRYLHIGIPADLGPQNDHADPSAVAQDPASFKNCVPLIEIAKAAKARLPDIELLASLESPPAWMKTNNAVGGGGKEKATLKPGMELKFAEYIWNFLAHMAKCGAPVKYVAISNECDWPHEQPGCFFTPEAHATLFKVAGSYLEKMAAKDRSVPRAILVGPNTLSAPGAAKDYLPAMYRNGANKYLEVIAAHDYDPRGDRWGALRKIAGERPVWMTEWCARDADESPGQINSGTLYAAAMHEAFAGGANVWMAYDWAYPPRKGGEALIHIDWGNDYTLKKPYWVFRQWASPLLSGMRIVAADTSGPSAAGVKATAFLAKDGKSLVVHIVNATDVEARIAMNISGAPRGKPATRHRTSATEEMTELPPLEAASGKYSEALPARSLTTYELEMK